MVLKLLAFLGFISCVLGATTMGPVDATAIVVEATTPAHNNHHHHHHTHATHEPAVKEVFKFHYDPKTHIVAAILGHECFLYSTSAQERLDVHDPTLFKQIEGKILQLVSTHDTNNVMTHADLSAKYHSLTHSCPQNGPVYPLNL